MSEVSEPLEIMENPMLVSSVLETVFGLLAVDDIKTCRFVCSAWKTEGFRALRKRTWINLTDKTKLQSFLTFSQRSIYTKFPFKVCDWSIDPVSTYLLGVEPSQIEAEVTLNLSHDQEDCGVSERLLEDLLVKQNRAITKLLIKLEWNEDHLDDKQRWTIPENLLCLRYPQLRKLIIFNSLGDADAAWLHPLWISIMSQSPQLKILRLKNMNEEEFWKRVSTSTRFGHLKELQYVDDNSASVLKMYEQLLQNPLPCTCLQRFHISFDDDNRSLNLLSRVLEQVAGTLEILEFYSQEQSALSPIRFPVMPQLRVLDAGSSQFSFPSITPVIFPKLAEIRATYWDWVFTFEDLPDTHYYWRTNDPHSCVTDIKLRFPNWFNLNIDYTRLEIFHEFVDVLFAKFPNACNLTIYNAPVCDDVRRALERLFHVFEFRIRSFKIASYCSSDVQEPTPFEVTVDVDETPNQERLLEVLDLGTGGWPGVWKSHPTMLTNIRDEWLPTLVQFRNLRVLKILWAKSLFTLLQLTNKDVLSNLEHLEFVGDRCIDRFERANVRRLRPLLRIIQRQNCYCTEEDWWYMYDPDSYQIFTKLFSIPTFHKFPLSGLLGERLSCLFGK
ncbi:hypothetical protein Ocin01_10429 [Orchesella cincta]|uniref:F-box domain-containing protein n=1 Tax=Orchesella cincta TaxID=48709 RepID=A0A1D2MT72_ORCCI|nr:hypothetical protein Ocin01_10429 [Orchesella cincta]